MGNSGLWLPRTMKPAVKRTAVCFYENPTTGRILVGAPEEFPLPDILKKTGYVKVVCRTAAEVDDYDQKMRDQMRRDDEMTSEQREAIEGPIFAAVRADLIHQMANARNDLNKAFCRAALQKMDEDAERKKMKRESFQHIVGYEDGH